MDITVKDFTGPIDLLLDLVKRHEIEIYEVWISRITSDYLRHLDFTSNLNLEGISQFLVIAANLVYLKSRALLPQEEEEREEEKRVLEVEAGEYEKYKRIALHLEEKEKISAEQFSRPPGPDTLSDQQEEYIEASLYELVAAFKNMMEDIERKKEVNEIPTEIFTIEAKMEEILNLSEEKDCLSFSQIFAHTTSRLEAVVIFLALLELMRLHKLLARQRRTFGAIELIRPQ